MFNFRFTDLIAFGLILAMPAQATNRNIKPAHEASPEHYEVLLQNEQVLVLKMVLNPGAADQLHQHQAETVYFEKGGKLRIKPLHADAFIADIPDGHVMWHEAWHHQVTNIGDSTVIAIIVEAKL